MKLTLPFPPYVNKLYGTRRNGQKFKKQAHVTFFSQAHQIIRKEKLIPLEGNLEVNIALFRPGNSGDIDGPLKTLFDALEKPSELVPVGGKKERKKTSKYGAYVNDSQIVELHVFKNIDRKNPRVEIEIRQKD